MEMKKAASMTAERYGESAHRRRSPPQQYQTADESQKGVVKRSAMHKHNQNALQKHQHEVHDKQRPLLTNSAQTQCEPQGQSEINFSSTSQDDTQLLEISAWQRLKIGERESPVCGG